MTWRSWCSLRRMRSVPPVAVVAFCVETALLAQIPDVTKSPPILSSAGQFSAAQLNRPVLIDGREWIAANVQTTSSPGTVPVPTKAFSLSLTDCGDHSGDFERCQLHIQRGGATPVRIDNGFTGWVFVTPDGRYIVTEPLHVLDVREWKQYALSEALQIPNYTNIEAISRDGKRLFISRRDCAMDCRDVRVEYYELTLPKANGQ
jgi:hypothetical protein